jgi:RNase adaptor protein for sRNA GlmZ degradation
MPWPVSRLSRSGSAADSEVMQAVMATRGVPALVQAIAATAQAFGHGPQRGPVTIAVGCVGGRHGSAAIAIEAARLLEGAGVPVTLTHRDMEQPVIARPAPETRTAGHQNGDRDG